jgi:hypothetical protein
MACLQLIHNVNLQHARHNFQLLTAIYFLREKSPHSRCQCLAFELSLLRSYYHSVRREGSPRYYITVISTAQEQKYLQILVLKYYQEISSGRCE